MLQKREMQMEIQRLSERENKRRKLATAAVSSAPANIINSSSSKENSVFSSMKIIASKCLIF